MIVAPVTTRIREMPAEVALGREDGLPKSCVVNLDTIVTISRSALRERITALRREKLLHAPLDDADCGSGGVSCIWRTG